jgi:hypothetical protein
MDSTLPLRTERTAASWLGTGLAGWLPLLGLLAWHGWLTLTLFGAENRWQQLLDNRPVVSGRHALHLYHATLGAQARRERGSFSCFDPAFQAGYPKTAVFDAGARPAEVFFFLTGQATRSKEEPLLAAPYKIGLAIGCLAAPLLLLAAARGAGLSLSATTLALAAGILVCWGTPGRQLLETGDLDLLLAGLAIVSGAGMLIFFDRAPGFRSWLGIFAAGCLGWFAQPLLFIMLLPLALVYYSSVGCKHRLAWHMALLFAVGGAFAVNCFWLLDWLAYWWIRSPLQGDVFVLAHRTFHTLWAAPLWGEPCERLFAGVLLLLAVVGLYVLNEAQQRATARLFGLGAVGFSVLALAGAGWEPLARLGASRLLVVALWFATVPAGVGLVQLAGLATRLLRSPLRAAALAGCLACALCLVAGKSLAGFGSRYLASTPLLIGLTAEQLGWVKALQENTTTEARILWEEDADDQPGSRWTALLPLLTGRYYLGGLDPQASIEHGYGCLSQHCLADRPLESWSEAELNDFYRRYNVGWIVCRSRASLSCLKNYPEAQPILFVHANEPRYLFELKPQSFVLRGQARLLEANTSHIALADLVPDKNGNIVLSMHYQPGMRVSCARVQIERESDPHDPVDFIRLRLQGPVARATITWQPGR